MNASTPVPAAPNLPPQHDPASIPCAIAGAVALALLAGLGILVIGLAGGGLEKDRDVFVNMGAIFVVVGGAIGWFGGRAASKLIEPGDSLGTGAVKIGGSAGGLGATIGGIGGIQFGALGCVLGGLIGAAVFGLVGAGLGALFVAVKNKKTAKV